MWSPLNGPKSPISCIFFSDVRSTGVLEYFQQQAGLRIRRGVYAPAVVLWPVGTLAAAVQLLLRGAAAPRGCPASACGKERFPASMAPPAGIPLQKRRKVSGIVGKIARHKAACFIPSSLGGPVGQSSEILKTVKRPRAGFLSSAGNAAIAAKLSHRKPDGAGRGARDRERDCLFLSRPQRHALESLQFPHDSRMLHI